MKKLYSVLLIAFAFQSWAQQVLPLYSTQIPNRLTYDMKEVRMDKDGLLIGYRNISLPTLEAYLPTGEKRTGSAVIICPGGGYGMESYRLEGTNIAETFVRHGIAAFILKYRLPSDSIMAEKQFGPLQDAQQAIKLVRKQALTYKIDPNKIGIMGFSAGGHLASTAGTHFTTAYIPNEEHISLRPDFMILVYPVISMTDELTHKGSRNNLLGKSPSREQIELFSNELQVSRETPPTWLTHTGDDQVVVVENSIRFYQQLIKNSVPAEMHLFPKGNHGFVLSQPTEEWMASIFQWMSKTGFN